MQLFPLCRLGPAAGIDDLHQQVCFKEMITIMGRTFDTASQTHFSHAVMFEIPAQPHQRLTTSASGT